MKKKNLNEEVSRIKSIMRSINESMYDSRGNFMGGPDPREDDYDDGSFNGPEDDKFDQIYEIAPKIGFNPPLTMDNADLLTFDASTDAGGKTLPNCTLSSVLRMWGYSNKEGKQKLIDFINSVASGDDFYIDDANLDIIRDMINNNVHPNDIDVEYDVDNDGFAEPDSPPDDY
jgi:hypothetical protein